jgi:hypothetical protein
MATNFVVLDSVVINPDHVIKVEYTPEGSVLLTMRDENTLLVPGHTLEYVMGILEG